MSKTTKTRHSATHTSTESMDRFLPQLYTNSISDTIGRKANFLIIFTMHLHWERFTMKHALFIDVNINREVTNFDFLPLVASLTWLNRVLYRDCFGDVSKDIGPYKFYLMVDMVKPSNINHCLINKWLMPNTRRFLSAASISQEGDVIMPARSNSSSRHALSAMYHGVEVRSLTERRSTPDRPGCKLLEYVVAVKSAVKILSWILRTSICAQLSTLHGCVCTCTYSVCRPDIKVCCRENDVKSGCVILSLIESPPPRNRRESTPLSNLIPVENTPCCPRRYTLEDDSLFVCFCSRKKHRLSVEKNQHDPR
jgi:hypothetical protein